MYPSRFLKEGEQVLNPTAYNERNNKSFVTDSYLSRDYGGSGYSYKSYDENDFPFEQKASVGYSSSYVKTMYTANAPK